MWPTRGKPHACWQTYKNALELPGNSASTKRTIPSVSYYAKRPLQKSIFTWGVPDLAAHTGAAADDTDDPRRATGTLLALAKDPILA